MARFSQKILSQAKSVRAKAREAAKGIDARLLSLSSVSVEQVRAKIKEAKKNVDLHTELSVSIASKILDKAREVRESLHVEKIPSKSKKKKTETNRVN